MGWPGMSRAAPAMSSSAHSATINLSGCTRHESYGLPQQWPSVCSPAKTNKHINKQINNPKTSQNTDVGERHSPEAASAVILQGFLEKYILLLTCDNSEMLQQSCSRGPQEGRTNTVSTHWETGPWPRKCLGFPGCWKWEKTPVAKAYQSLRNVTAEVAQGLLENTSPSALSQLEVLLLSHWPGSYEGETRASFPP